MPHAIDDATDALLVALLVALGVLLIVGCWSCCSRASGCAPARRRARPIRGCGVIGAWQESLDVLTEAGLPELTHVTSAEIATADRRAVRCRARRATRDARRGRQCRGLPPVRGRRSCRGRHGMAAARTVRKQVHRQLGVRGRLAAGLRYQRHGRIVDPVSPEFWDSAEHSEPTADPTAPAPALRGPSAALIGAANTGAMIAQ